MYLCELPVSSSVRVACCQYSWALTVYTSSEASEPWSQLAVFLSERGTQGTESLSHHKGSHAPASPDPSANLSSSTFQFCTGPIRNEQHPQGQMFPSVPLRQVRGVRTLLQRFSAELKNSNSIFVYGSVYRK